MDVKKYTFIGLIVLGVLFGSRVEAQEWVGVVIHHSASPEWTTAKDINRWHKERGFDEIGYNFVIKSDGQIERGRDLSKPGAHALNPAPSRNRTHIGICLTGYNNFTKEQYASLRKLLRELGSRYPDLVIERHHEECPGSGFEWGLLTLQEEIL